MSALDPATLLSVWEHGLARHPLDRALLLLTLVSPDTPVDALADVPLGQRNQLLASLRERIFGRALELTADCPACGERMEFPLPPEALPAKELATGPIEVGGLNFQLPTTRHLARISTLGDADEAARALLRACASTPEALPEDEQLDTLLAEVEAKLDEADPWADLSITVVCPVCAHADEVLFDPGSVLWDALDGEAQHLLDEVHLLASRYGWSEAEILKLGSMRRNAYLARVLA